MQPPTCKSALPAFYYTLFAICEPALVIIGCLVAVHDPKAIHNAQAPWPAGTSPPEVLPKASIVTVTQLAHVCGLMGVLNTLVLTAIRKHLASQPAVQEKIVQSLLLPLLFGDFVHIYITLWALGEGRWNVAQWSSLLWVTIGAEVVLFTFRSMWYIGVGRYVDTRDRAPAAERNERPAWLTYAEALNMLENNHLDARDRASVRRAESNQIGSQMQKH